MAMNKVFFITGYIFQNKQSVVESANAFAGDKKSFLFDKDIWKWVATWFCKTIFCKFYK
jgi:hypothetical protein